MEESIVFDVISISDLLVRYQSELKGAKTVLKMDIEGSEWEVLANTVSLGTFKQIVIEFHGLRQLINQDYFVIPIDQISKIKSVLTIVNGQIVYSDTH